MYSVKFSRTAAQDLDDAHDYICGVLKNPTAAANLVLELESKLEGIREFPDSCGLVQDSYLKSLGIRFLLVKNFVAFLKVEESLKEIQVVRFLYGKRQWAEILQEKTSDS
ncbi:MAG: type II toxin-antitoxin system RelE/ParE family toxin [Spirochaetaceae bacterium]|nr:MAG: type II toxin-antitoxin system RelE/ParE family toxin [Spirochaetaceae bacterium]